MKLTRILPITLFTLALVPAVAGAQATVAPTEVATVATAEAAPVAGPRLDQARAGFTSAREAASVSHDPVPQPSISRRRGVREMIIGGAAIVGGALVGGDAGGIVSFAGLGYGLYGLYIYLQ